MESCINIVIDGVEMPVYGNYEYIFYDKLGCYVVDKPISMNTKCRLDEDIQARFDDISKIMYNHMNKDEFPPCQECWNQVFEHLKYYFGYDIVGLDVLNTFYFTFERLFMLYANDINASFWGPNHDYFEKYEV